MLFKSSNIIVFYCFCCQLHHVQNVTGQTNGCCWYSYAWNLYTVCKLKSVCLDRTYKGYLSVKVNCPHCSELSTIKSRNRLSVSVSELYCQCENPLCGAGFVMTLAHKHDTRPPKDKFDCLVADLVSRLSPDERRQLSVMLRD